MFTLLGTDSDGDGAEDVCFMQIKKEKGKITFKIIDLCRK